MLILRDSMLFAADAVKGPGSVPGQGINIP